MPSQTMKKNNRKSVGRARLRMLWTVIVVAVLSLLLVCGSMITIALSAGNSTEGPSVPPNDDSATSDGVTNENHENSEGLTSEDKTTNGSSGDVTSSSATSGDTDSEGETSSGSGDGTSDKGNEHQTSEENNDASDPTPPVAGDEILPFKPEDKVIAITFDDGPSVYTDIILDKLEGTDDKVTYFIVGERVDSYAAQLKRAVGMGCEIGSHTYSHTYLTQMSATELQESLQKTEDVVRKYGGEISILRPPGGYYEKSADYGYPLIMWGGDTEDWKRYGEYKKGTLTKDEAVDAVYNAIMKDASSGSIILLHDLYETSALAFCKAYDTLKAQGYRFVTVSEMLGIEGRDVKPYVVYSTRLIYLHGERIVAE